jgi:uncharacterized protein (DUF2141 family)
MRVWTIGVLALAAMAAGGVVAQQRDVTPAGKGRLAGRVVTMDAAAEPVRNAIVTVSAPELSPPRSTITDDDGRFTFANLPAGRFTITASKAAHVTTAYGAKRPARPGIPVPLADGQQLTGLTVRLARGAVITGRVTNRAGQPVSMVQVVAVRAELANGPGGTARGTGDVFVTDDRGAYRIYGLEPGTYLVAALSNSTALGDLEATSAAEVDAALAALRSRATAAPAALRASAPPPPVTYVMPAFFAPGTASAADAQRITLAIGEERDGTDVTVEPLRAGIVEGVLNTTDGSAAANVLVSLVRIGPPLPTGPGPRPDLLARTAADGRFKLPAAAPGQYVITAQAPPRYVSETLTVAGDVQVALTLAPMPAFKGRLAFDRTTLPLPDDVTKVRLQLALPTTAAMPGNAGVGRGSAVSPGFAFVKPDGTFEFAPMAPGTYRLMVTVPGAAPGVGWWPRSTVVAGKDVLDVMVDLRANMSDAVLTLSDRHTELSGSIAAPSGQPVSDLFVIVFPTDRALWLRQGRRLQLTRPGTDGRFVFRDLPPGEYFLAALSDVDQDEWQDEAFLSQVTAAGAARIALAEGQSRVQDLKIGGIGPDLPD